jgi:hypothetical protein
MNNLLLVFVFVMCFNQSVFALSNKEIFDLQKECSNISENRFNNAWDKNNPLVFYQSHYNQNLNKCFMEVSETILPGNPDKGNSLSYTVFDTLTKKEYGYVYIWRPANKKYWEGELQECEINGSDCNSVKEFNDYVKDIMAEDSIKIDQAFISLEVKDKK